VGLESVPLFRYRLALVASPRHRLAGACSLRVRSLADEVWLVDPDGTDPASPVFQLLRRLAVPEERVRVFPSQTAAWVAAEEGHGIELERRSLVTLNVEGTPLELLWYATMLAPDRRSPAAAALRRFMETPDATHAMHAPLSGVPPSRFRPPVYVTLWS
jgi:DNA-binding transcriptional LysR family regulator